MSNEILSDFEYWNTVEYLADEAIDRVYEDYIRNNQITCEDEIDTTDVLDMARDCLHELVDGSEIAIYNRYHPFILRHSANENAIQEIYDAEGIGELYLKGGISGIQAAAAFFALYEDVNYGLGTSLFKAISHTAFEDKED